MKKPTLIAFCVSLLLVLSCEEKERYTLRFNHYLHVEETALECDQCHGELHDGTFAAPDHDACIVCHEELIDADEISPETCGVCHIEKDLDTIGEAEKPQPPTRGVFRHAPVLAERCADCHGRLLKTSAEYVAVWSRSDVIAVREKAHATIGLACDACHERLRPDQMPDDHRRNWTRRHGMLADQTDAACSVCHQQENCRGCHQSQQPASHNNLWRLRTHGMEASWGRQRCQVCHQDDFCDACHRATRPRSHGAGWARHRHCLRCHSAEASSSGCATCHRGSNAEFHSDAWASLDWDHNELDNRDSCFDARYCHLPGGLGPPYSPP